MLTVQKCNVLPEKPDMSPCRSIENMLLKTGLSKPMILPRCELSEKSRYGDVDLLGGEIRKVFRSLSKFVLHP